MKMLFRARIVVPVVLALSALALLGETPPLNIRTMHRFPQEEQRKEQMERLARKYDLAKYTITRDIVIDRGAMNHSSPVLTLNLRFLDNDDLALSAYVHEQGHWLLMERQLFRASITACHRATEICAAAISISRCACWSGRPWNS